ncbi:MAG: hypothetical protein KW806_02935 [Candidatus Yanofskybacteria bacterium]|nr:hypothetical protein [Candidatus Yanofskybacteria bacterium]
MIWLVWSHILAFCAGAYLERHRTKAVVKELFELFKKEEIKKIHTIDIEDE